MAIMPNGTLSEIEQKILLALWKMGGVGRNLVKENMVKAALAPDGREEEWSVPLQNLLREGFLEIGSVDGATGLSLTLLGLSILRKIEEDKLQEL